MTAGEPSRHSDLGPVHDHPVTVLEAGADEAEGQSRVEQHHRSPHFVSQRIDALGQPTVRKEEALVDALDSKRSSTVELVGAGVGSGENGGFTGR